MAPEAQRFPDYPLQFDNPYGIDGKVDDFPRGKICENAQMSGHTFDGSSWRRLRFPLGLRWWTLWFWYGHLHQPSGMRCMTLVLACIATMLISPRPGPRFKLTPVQKSANLNYFEFSTSNHTKALPSMCIPLRSLRGGLSLKGQSLAVCR